MGIDFTSTSTSASNAQRAVYNVAVAIRAGPLFRYYPGAYVVVEVGVVDRLAGEPPLFEPVDAAVAYVGNRRAVAYDMDERDRGRHGLVGGVALGHLEYVAVGELYGAAYKLD